MVKEMKEKVVNLSIKDSQDISLLKGVAILLVLFIHANVSSYVPGFEEKSAIGVYTQVITRVLVDNAVPMFFLVSGFLFFLKKDTYAIKWKKRFKSLVIPYLFWCFIGFLIPFILQRVLGLDKFFTGSDLKKIADFEIIDYLRMFWDIRDGAPILSTMWFLRNLIVLIALTPIIELLLKKLGYFFVILLTIIYLFLPFAVPGISSSSLWWFTVGCSSTLIGGGKLFSCISRLSGLLTMVIWFISLFMIVLSYYYDWHYELLHRLFMVVHFIGIFKLLSYISSKCSTSRLRKVAVASFFIYAVHEPWMGYGMGVCFKVIQFPSIGLYIAPFIFVAFATVFSYLAYLILKKVAPSALNVITGSRT